MSHMSVLAASMHDVSLVLQLVLGWQVPSRSSVTSVIVVTEHLYTAAFPSEVHIDTAVQR